MIAWFICPYVRGSRPSVPTRVCQMDQYTSTIRADGGDWSESEVLGNYAVVKVRALSSTLDTIAADPDFYRFPIVSVNDGLATVSGSEVTALRTRIQAMGYSLTEIQVSLGSNLKSRTLGDVLRFTASRRLKPRYNSIADEIVLDGPVQTCRSIDAVDGEVQ